jgi:mono/diheme cytochrome c family protein
MATFTLPSCNENTYMQGARLYTFHCANCHMEDGSGLENVIPSIAQSEYFASKIDSLPCLIRHGKSSSKSADSLMVDMPVNYQMTEYEINNVINHIMVSWYPDREAVTIQDTRNNLEDCPIPAMRYGQ